MSVTDDSDLSTLSNNKSIYIPVSTDKQLLLWDDNDATILGLLFEVGKHYKKTGLFQPLFNNRAVALSNGRLAVEDPNTAYYITGAIIDDCDFDKPAPPSADRLAQALHGRGR